MSSRNHVLALGGTATGLAVLGYYALAGWKQRSQDETRANDQLPKISTKIMSKTMVKLSSREEESREPISEVDEWLCRSSHWLRFCFRFDEMLDQSRVRKGLQRTLTHFPALAARVDRENNDIMYEFVLTNESNGVELEVLVGHVIREKLPDASSHRKQWQQAGLDGPLAGFEGEPGPDDPLMRARLILFPEEGVSYLAIGISHGLGDGHSITDILQTWSHFCISETAEDLPSSLRRPRSFGQRVTQPITPAKSVKELENRVAGDVGCTINPLSRWAFFGCILPQAMWTMSRQKVLELRIIKKHMASLKNSVMDALPEGAWVSRFEVLIAAMLVAQRATTDTPRDMHHKLHISCNLRGRVSRFPLDYFGNSSFDFFRHISLPHPVAWDLETIKKVAIEVHRAVRDGLADPESLTLTKDWFEAARHLGLRNKYDVWPIIFDTLRGTGTFVNSWDDRWLKIKMGASRDAAAFQAFFGTAANLIVEVPRDRESGDTTVHLALPPWHAENFVEFCGRVDPDKNCIPPIPFSIVQLYQ